MTDKNILAIIPARGGSKGLPRKNIIDLAGKPLMAWSIEAALASKYITMTVVSSEDEEILATAVAQGVQGIKRPDELAQDISASEPVITHTIKALMEKESKIFDYLVLLQPTSPLRTVEHIDAAFKKLFDSNADALISVSPYDKKVLKAFLQNSDGYLQGIANNRYPFMRRQDLPDVWMPNGAIYIINVNAFLKNESFFTAHTIAFRMSDESSIDIDTPEDLQMAKKIIRDCGYE